MTAAGGRTEIARALAMQRAGRVREAAEIYRAILVTEASNVDALHYLGLASLQLGSIAEACALLGRAAELQPASANILADLGTALVRARQFPRALQLFARALEIDPGHADALNNMGVTLDDLRQPSQALPYFERLVTVRGSAAAWSQLAATQLKADDAAAAIEGFRRALQLDPRRTRDRILLGEALEAAGRFRQARFQYVTVLAEEPRNVVALARLLGLRGEVDPRRVAAAEELLRDPKLEDGARVRLHVALGQHYDTSADYDRAFTHAAAANKLRFARAPFDSTGFSAAVDRLIAFFTPERFRSLAATREASRRPIFIVGMPRSGTTLTEQILASHTDVAAGGELLTIMNLCSQVEALSPRGRPYPEGLPDLSASQLGALARNYVERLEKLAPSPARVTDKQPFNFMHLGLIAALFPHAYIVHCRRQPLDTCLSCYFVSFADELQFASDLGTLGRYYVDYQRLMEHWRRVLPIPILDLDYERLVQDNEVATRELLSYCDLPWQEACLRFYETQRDVRTPSRWQVRQPLYSQSIDRWKRYEQHLEPLLRIIRTGGHP